MKVIKTGVSSWENRHETFIEQIKDLYELGNEDNLDALDSYNDATKGLQKLIQEAIETDTPLRSLGAGWSWTKIATVKDGVMLDTKPLNTRFTVAETAVNPAYAGNKDQLLFAQSGNGIWELGAFLKNRGLSLKTSGASNGQTIAGAMGTGTHGSAFDFGAVPDFVVGLHIVVSPDRHIWLERASAPVVAQRFVDLLQTELVQDDELFNAAVVSFGSFGIIHGVLMETEPLFLLETYVQRLPYNAELQGMMETLDFSNTSKLPCGNERPFHFSVLLNPYDLDKGAFVTTMYKRAYRTNYQPPVDNAAGIGPGDDAASFIGTITDAIPALIPVVVTKVLNTSMTTNTDPHFGTLGEIFSNTTLRGKLLSSAIGFPAELSPKVADLMLKINKDIGPFSGVFSFRFVKQTKATLGFTRFGYTCIMELDAPLSDKAYNFYTQVWLMLEQENIPFTFHWGKANEVTPARIQRMYGDAAARWINARKTLLNADCQKVFTNQITQEWGLA
ncbi:FAD-binding protein [Mucilaginibacter kameinonensis]|uniref:FAD-binding protein n=1 Tax=Mucilaginibacter kameinonensis TaxID=452286 RepID=UPI000EF82681|nr:FAD-binding protein [Mucilaginibacter kameinonensis]